MCLRTAQNIISGAQYPLLSRMLRHHRKEREPDGPLVSTGAGGAPGGQLHGSAGTGALLCTQYKSASGGPSRGKKQRTNRNIPR